MSFAIYVSSCAYGTLETIESLEEDAFEDSRERDAGGHRHARCVGVDENTSSAFPGRGEDFLNNTVYLGAGGEVATDLHVVNGTGGAGGAGPILAPTTVRGIGRIVMRRTWGLASSLFSATLSSSSSSDGGMPISSRRASFKASIKSLDGGGRRGRFTSLSATLL
jgi:hypothetical protein